MLAPAAFLSLAEELGLIGDFDLWALDQAVTALAGWSGNPDGDADSNPESGRPLYVAVNL